MRMLCLAACITLAASLACGQGLPPPIPKPRFDIELTTVCPGDLVTVFIVGRKVQGKVVTLQKDDTVLVLDLGSQFAYLRILAINEVRKVK